MSVTAFHDFPLAPRDRKWDGAAAENACAPGREPKTSPTASTATPTSGTTPAASRTSPPTSSCSPTSSTAATSPCPGDHRRGQHHAGRARRHRHPQSDITRVKNHLAKYYKKMGETAPWERD